MDDTLQRALLTDRLIDITTTGRRSGTSHRIEISFHFIQGEVYISGTPGKRDWYANLIAHPEFTFHLKQSVRADLRAQAEPVVEMTTRREVLAEVVAAWGRVNQLESSVERSPLVRVRFLSDNLPG